MTVSDRKCPKLQVRPCGQACLGALCSGQHWSPKRPTPTALQTSTLSLPRWAQVLPSTHPPGAPCPPPHVPPGYEWP